MKNIAFTICAKNYLGLSQVLEDSIKKYNKDTNFYIFIADEFNPSDEIPELPQNIIIAKDALEISKEDWDKLSFKYDLTEFCTCIKPFCFNYIFKRYATDSCIYFDPDILVFNSLDYVYKILEQKSIVLTPHITSMEEVYSGNLNEQNLLFSGMFNLGFLGLRNDETSMKMLKWWENRLKDRCYRSMTENYFTDQKWIDFLPSFFPTELHISFNLGLNVAPWNFHEREIVVKDKTFFVKNRCKSEEDILYPLIFVHFSGFDYNQLFNDVIFHTSMKNLKTQPDLIDIFQEYSSLLRTSNYSRYINLRYSYDFFSNGIYISLIYRKLYRRLSEDNRIDSNPFQSDEQFYQSLTRSGFIKKNMHALDKSTVENVQNSNRKILLINRLLYLLFKIIGVNRFFMLTKLMRLYSKTENHVYLIDRSYLKSFSIRH